MGGEHASQRHFGHAGASLESPWSARLLGPAWDLAAALARDHAPRTARALDVGCGAGQLLTRLQPLCREVVGLDVTRTLLGPAQARTGAPVAQGTAHALPFRSASFGLVISTSAWHHFDQPALAAAEFARVLEPGGLLVVVDFERRTRLHALVDRLLRAVEASHAGFRHSREVLPMLAAAGLTGGRTVQLPRRLPVSAWTATKPR